MRTKIIAGNWKMNKTVPEAVELAKAVVSVTNGASSEVVICPTFVALGAVNEVVKGTHVALGAQDVHWEKSGAYTGKVSCDMLKSVGVKYVIIGHSEQRTLFGETNDSVNKKVKAVLASGMIPIVCVGETLNERESGVTEKVVESHVRGAYKDISAEDAVKTVIAYEPVWAIGTGKVATPEQAQEVHAFIRKLITEMYGAKISDSLRIQYGGSMKADNAQELLKKQDIDGGLIGGASLKADDFNGIVRA